MRSILWMIRHFGLRRSLSYRRAYRSGIVIDYSSIFTSDELAKIGEHFEPAPSAPWEQAR